MIPVLDLSAEKLVLSKRIDLSPLTEGDGRITFYETPEPGGLYVAGSDFAYGLEGRDWDACIIIRKDVEPRPRQVATLKGHWGPTYHRVLYAALRYWNEAFLMGERQVGLLTLQTLWSEYSYRKMYRERVQEKPNQPHVLRLGHPRTADDITLRALRMAVMDRSIDLVDEELIDQMSRLSFYSPMEERTLEKVGDEKLKLKLAGGGSPDLVMALCYAYTALGEVHKYVEPEPRYKPGTYGYDLGHLDEEARWDAERNPQEASWVKR